MAAMSASPLIGTIQSEYDVVVVGARAAGASTAMLLARRGLSTLAIDRAGYGSDTLSTHSLASAGVLQLSRWGVLDEIRRAGTPVANTVRFHYGDEEVAIEVQARGDVDGLYSPRRTVLDAALVDAAVAAGADVRHGVAMVRLTPDRSGCVDGVEIDVDGRRRIVRARFVVGADGLRSRVARQVAAPVVHEDSACAASVFAYFDGLPHDTIENHYGTDRVVGVIPTNDDLACVWVGMPRRRFDRAVRGRVAAGHTADVGSVPALAEALGGRSPVGGYRTFVGAPGLLRRAWGAGWALVGDAGYFKDPLSAHGITDAFIGAELLADALTDTLVHGVDADEALGEYQRLRDEMAGQMMPPVAAAASFPGDMTVVRRAFRDMSRAMRHEFALVESRFGAVAAG
jgi:flavin-dependent dehydrogenase